LVSTDEPPTAPGDPSRATATAPSPATVRRWRRHLADEALEAAVYRHLAAHRDGDEREILLALAAAEGRHAAHWERLLVDHGRGRGRASLSSLLLAWLARHFGSVFVLALAQRAETRSAYSHDPDATRTMAADEQIHAEVVRGLAERGRERVSGTFRAAVFGANDGLVSNLALVLGIAGSGVETSTVLLTGLAGLLAGALSMGAGEFISVRSQRELLAASTVGEAHIQAYPHLDVDAHELALVYRARGMSAEEAERHAAEQLAAWPDVGGHTTGAAGHDIVGTGLSAGLSSFAFFAAGAAIPVLPFLLGMSGAAALITACVLVGTALMVTGATVGLLSGAPPLRRSLRQLSVGAGAAAVTYGLGHAFGATVA
jgi:vacuolar iron transporter family protein